MHSLMLYNKFMYADANVVLQLGLMLLFGTSQVLHVPKRFILSLFR